MQDVALILIFYSMTMQLYKSFLLYVCSESSHSLYQVILHILGLTPFPYSPYCSVPINLHMNDSNEINCILLSLSLR